jgi:hypothetical protein
MAMKLGIKKKEGNEDAPKEDGDKNEEQADQEQEPENKNLMFRGKKIEIDEVKATEEIQTIINTKRKEMNIFDI